MDAFEFLVASLLKKDRYWVDTSYMVELTTQEKLAINRPSSPRWEIDLIAYKASENFILAVECKSYLDSLGVRYIGLSGQHPTDSKRYKLFNDPVLRRAVLRQLAKQLVAAGACSAKPRVHLCLATGKVASAPDRAKIHALFQKRKWLLSDDKWIRDRLERCAADGYQNNIAVVPAKILSRTKRRTAISTNAN